MTAILNPPDEQVADQHATCSHAADDRVMLFVPVDGPPVEVAADGETRAGLHGPTRTPGVHYRTSA